jgi:hypothetical protein
MILRKDLDYSRFAEAEKLVAEGDRVVEANCSCCQGHSLPGREKGKPGYCPECGGEAYVRVPAWKRWPLEGKVDYWQARALVAECRLDTEEQLRKGLEVLLEEGKRT